MKQKQVRKKRLTLKELAHITGAKVEGDGEYEIQGANDLASARSDEISFLAHPKYHALASKSKAGALCVPVDFSIETGHHFLLSKDPSLTFQKILSLFFEPIGPPLGCEGVHPHATIHKNAKVAKSASVGPYSVIDKDVSIGENTLIYPGVFIGEGSSIGEGCIIYAGAVIREGCIIGDRVILQPGAVIGSCGFGYITSSEGKHQKLEQMGTVVLEDDVEIGANSTVDRARFKETRVKRGTKIDNLVQIGHNVIIGEDNIIVSQTGIAGSTKTGKRVVMGGQTGIVGHITIADDVQIATRGGVSRSLTKSGKYGGTPAYPLYDYHKDQILLRQIQSYKKRLDALEKRCEKLEENHDHHLL